MLIVGVKVSSEAWKILIIISMVDDQGSEVAQEKAKRDLEELRDEQWRVNQRKHCQSEVSSY